MSMSSNLQQKFVSLPVLLRKLKSLRRRKKIAFTNGCFDILHYGHARYLERAKTANRILVVGLNSDASVFQLKGPGRPVTDQKARAGVLAALQAVDFVVIFNEDTPQTLIEAVKPDVLIKGADWKGKEIAGGAVVKSYGGKVEFIKFENGFSTTQILEKIYKSSK